jgi:hypothetical protein
VLAKRLRVLLANKLLELLINVEIDDWVWFETGLTYDNARLSQALIVTGAALTSPAYIAAGLRSLDWLMSLQTNSTGQFRPIGTDGFGELHGAPKPFDQQPVEAAAAISACIAAYQIDNDPRWRRDAERAFAWFLGANDLKLPLADIATGGCRDGLHADRVNQNEGGESVVSYLLGLAEMRFLARLAGDQMCASPAQNPLRA